MRNTKLIAQLIETKAYIKYNPELFLKADQKTTLICNVSLSQKVLRLSCYLSTFLKIPHAYLAFDLIPRYLLDCTGQGKYLFWRHFPEILVYELWKM
mgnify:CR=1 FL=1